MIKFESLWEEHNSKVNTIIGKLLVPVMRTGDPLLKEAHQDLVAFSIWFDEQMEAIDEQIGGE